MSEHTPFALPSFLAAQDKMRSFAPFAGHDYARLRNFDIPNHPHVSGLSPYLRHRMITEADVLKETLALHPPARQKKFVQEVVWRTYWKGWLEMRPAVWTQYQTGLHAALNRIQTESALRQQWQSACEGTTGIDGFDHWAKELRQTGYLHNHARMWFASIWIFTLRLPWELGADFFLRHLLDGDPASNTLSWRWVGGIQTEGKAYLASRSNIAQFTIGRFAPNSLIESAQPLAFTPHPEPAPLPAATKPAANARTLFLITEEDLSPEWVLNGAPAPYLIATLNSTKARSPLHISNDLSAWTDAAMTDCLARHGCSGAIKLQGAPDLAEVVKAHNIEQIVTSYLPIGPARDTLSAANLDTPLVQVMRAYDRRWWPHATHGFFRFRKIIPQILESLA